MKNNQMVRLGLIALAACAFIYLIHSYNTGDNLNVEDNMMNTMENFQVDENVVNPPVNQNTMSQNANINQNQPVNNAGAVLSENNEDPQPSDGDNEVFRTVEQKETDESEELNRLPNECYPKDTLSPQDLLPQDANSTWAQTVPAGQGSLGDQNFLNAGFHVGINTVGQSLRNANRQLRSEPPNPQMKVSPWLQSTIEPDVNRRAMEIGA